MDFGHKLKILRTAKRIEPIVMAIELGISESTYRRYERNESDPTLTILKKIATLFEISLSELLEENATIIITPRSPK